MSTPCNRRRFLTSCGLVAAGAAAGTTWPLWGRFATAALADDASPGHEARLKQLGLELPAVTPPRNTYVAVVKVGEFLYVSGHGPGSVDGQPIVGKVGRDLELEAGKQAAKQCGLRILAAVRAELGSLDKVVRVVKTLGMVNCTADFTEQPAVINGCSDLMVQVFGEQAGTGARSAVGMGSLPGGMPVEVEMVFQVR